jgi:hypothetical protein
LLTTRSDLKTFKNTKKFQERGIPPHPNATGNGNFASSLPDKYYCKHTPDILIKIQNQLIFSKRNEQYNIPLMVIVCDSRDIPE